MEANERRSKILELVIYNNFILANTFEQDWQDTKSPRSRHWKRPQPADDNLPPSEAGRQAKTETVRFNLKQPKNPNTVKDFQWQGEGLHHLPSSITQICGLWLQPMRSLRNIYPVKQSWWTSDMSICVTREGNKNQEHPLEEISDLSYWEMSHHLS